MGIRHLIVSRLLVSNSDLDKIASSYLFNLFYVPKYWERVRVGEREIERKLNPIWIWRNKKIWKSWFENVQKQKLLLLNIITRIVFFQCGYICSKRFLKEQKPQEKITLFPSSFLKKKWHIYTDKTKNWVCNHACQRKSNKCNLVAWLFPVMIRTEQPKYCLYESRKFY